MASKFSKNKRLSFAQKKNKQKYEKNNAVKFNKKDGNKIKNQFKHIKQKNSKFKSNNEKEQKKRGEKDDKKRKAENFKHKKVPSEIKQNSLKNQKNEMQKTKDEKVTEPISRLKIIYYDGKCPDKVEKFAKSINKEIIKEEISFFGYIIKQPEYDKSLVIFIAEIISKFSQKHNLSVFINICFKLLDDITLKKSIFQLRIIFILSQIPFYIPMSIQIIKIYEIAQKLNNSETCNKQIDLDKLKLTKDILESVDLKNFLLEESLAILFANLNCISDSVGFPEVSSPIIEFLRSKFNEKDDFDLKDFLNRIENQSQKIQKKRKNLIFKNYDDFVEFEKATPKMIP